MNRVLSCFLLGTLGVLLGSLWLSYQTRFDFVIPADIWRTLPLIFLWVISLKLLGLWSFRQFKVILRHFSGSEFSSLFKCLFTTCLLVYGIASLLGWDYSP